MQLDFSFNPQVFENLIGGLSALDTRRLSIQSLDEAYEFVRAYGYDVQNPEHIQNIWRYHRRAVTFLKEELLDSGEIIPESLTDPAQLKDIAYLLIYASTGSSKENSLQRWSCAILKVMHVLVHLDNDLFTFFSQEIQDQILKPIQAEIYTDPVAGKSLGGPSEREHIPLQKFEIKTFKTSNSSVLKLIAKRELFAFTNLDKVGVRFVTKHLFDSFRVIRYLVRKNIVSFPHNIFDQSNNTLYPTNIFFEVMESLTKKADLTLDEVDQLLKERLAAAKERARYREKLNTFSSREYRFMKFINRRLIRVRKTEKDAFSFFYPFEVQIVDYETYLQNTTGESSHEAYKLRQRNQARSRILTDLGAP